MSPQELGSVETIEAALDDDVGDELLSLIFTACHPGALPQGARGPDPALIGGLTPTRSPARSSRTSQQSRSRGNRSGWSLTGLAQLGHHT